MSPAVFHYSDPRSFLVDAFQRKRDHNPLFSARAWAKQMGFKCHSSLLFFMNGQRQIRPAHVDQLLKGLRLPSDEEKYFRALVHRQNAATPAEKEHYESELKLLHPSRGVSVLRAEHIRLVSDWIHMALLEMTLLKDFQASSEWIEKRLFFKVKRHQIDDALNRLINLGLLKRENGTLVKTNEHLTTPKNLPSECIREHHRQFHSHAIRAIEEQNVKERIFNSCTMTINANKLEDAQNLILKFREDMCKLMEKQPGDETYQLNIAFFKLTAPAAKSSASEGAPT